MSMFHDNEMLMCHVSERSMHYVSEMLMCNVTEMSVCQISKLLMQYVSENYSHFVSLKTCSNKCY